MDQEKLAEDYGILIGRLFTLGGSMLFLIGSFIAAVIAYKAYQTDLRQLNS